MGEQPTEEQLAAIEARAAAATPGPWEWERGYEVRDIPTLIIEVKRLRTENAELQEAAGALLEFIDTYNVYDEYEIVRDGDETGIWLTSNRWPSDAMTRIIERVTKTVKGTWNARG